MSQECDCAPQASSEELKRMDYWLSGGDVIGFPKHDRTPFKGYVEDKGRAVITQEDLREYREKNRLTLAERLRK